MVRRVRPEDTSSAAKSSLGVEDIKVTRKELESTCTVAKIVLPSVAVVGVVGAIISGNIGLIALACVNAGLLYDFYLIASWKHKEIVASKMDTPKRAVEHVAKEARIAGKRVLSLLNGGKEEDPQERLVKDAIEQTFFLKNLRNCGRTVGSWFQKTAEELEEAVQG